MDVSMATLAPKRRPVPRATAAGRDDRQFERLKVQIELQRLDLERLKISNEKTRNFLDRWRTDITPIVEQGNFSRKATNDFSTQALRSLFLLNGGALVAFPAFAKLVNISIAAVTSIFIGAMLAFTIGLSLTVLAIYLAYLGMDDDFRALRHNAEIMKFRLNRNEAPDHHNQIAETGKRDAENAALRHGRRGAKRVKYANAIGISALFAFLIGVGLSAAVLVRPDIPAQRNELQHTP